MCLCQLIELFRLARCKLLKISAATRAEEKWNSHKNMDWNEPSTFVLKQRRHGRLGRLILQELFESLRLRLGERTRLKEETTITCLSRGDNTHPSLASKGQQPGEALTASANHSPFPCLTMNSLSRVAASPQNLHSNALLLVPLSASIKLLGPSYSGPVPEEDLARDDRGRPLEGHLTIASFAWWRSKFAEAGFVHSPEMEQRLYRDIEPFELLGAW